MQQSKVTNSLDGFILYYEDMEKKKVKKATKKVEDISVNTEKVPLKVRIGGKLAPIKQRFNNVVKKAKAPRKSTKKLTKAERETLKMERRRGILGIGLLLVVVSIIFSTYVAIKFVDGVALYIALAPQVIFAAVSLFKAFSKIYK